VQADAKQVTPGNLPAERDRRRARRRALREAIMELKTVATPHVPVRYFEGGTGAPLVFLHGAGGVTAGDPFLAKLATKYHVYAPLLPGLWRFRGMHELRDMLDFTLHSWDVVDALGLKIPILVGHSMGGMIAAEMAAVAPHDVDALGLIAPAGLWLDNHPIPDMFATMPYEFPRAAVPQCGSGHGADDGGLALDDPEWLKGFLVTNARQLGMAGRSCFPIPERGLRRGSIASRPRRC
jgi:pimeloyl-ACP methyl ester carboxylesterase